MHEQSDLEICDLDVPPKRGNDESDYGEPAPSGTNAEKQLDESKLIDSVDFRVVLLLGMRVPQKFATGVV
jgi:hypothetical protein